MRFLRDTRTVFSREFIPMFREPVGLVFDMAQPLLFLFLFGSLLGGARDFGGAGADPGSHWQWFVPGILVMMCLFGPMSGGYLLFMELTGGSMERMLVTPLNRTAMLVGRTLKESAVLLAQTVLIVAIAVPLGFELHLVGVLAGLAMLVVLGVGLGALAFVLAIRSLPSGTLFHVVTQLVLFPLLLLSGVLLPVESGPPWLRAVAALNPVAYVVDAQRALFAGRLADPSVSQGAVAACALAVVGLVAGNRAMRRGL